MQVYPKVAPVLVQRFREREETVKQDVFQVRRSGVEWGLHASLAALPQLHAALGPW